VTTVQGSATGCFIPPGGGRGTTILGFSVKVKEAGKLVKGLVFLSPPL